MDNLPINPNQPPMPPSPPPPVTPSPNLGGLASPTAGPPPPPFPTQPLPFPPPPPVSLGEPASPTGGRPSFFKNLEFGGTGALIGLLVILVTLLTLNYFNILSLSLLFPEYLNWLPHRPFAVQTQRPRPQTTTPPTQAPTVNPSFTPTFTPESQKGSLVDSFSVSYTLVGKITQVAAKTGGKYDIEVTARDGSQKYTMTDVGGEGVLTTTNKTKTITFADLKEGDDVIVDLTVSSSKDGTPKVFIGQIAVSSR